MSVAYDKLLSTLVESSLIKAALIISPQGEVLGARGQAQVLRQSNAKVHVDMPGVGKPATPVKEHVYMVHLDEEVLTVVFAEDVEFERVRKIVETVLNHMNIPRPIPAG